MIQIDFKPMTVSIIRKPSTSEITASPRYRHHFISAPSAAWMAGSRIGDRMLVAIRNGSLPPLSEPNVLRNVIAHEIGHAAVGRQPGPPGSPAMPP
jgi:Zn-dependent protease with chaperone function